MTQDKKLLTFPCQFPIKVFGEQSDAFEETIYSIIHAHVPDLTEGAIKARPSKGGKYLAITVTIQAQSQDQLDAIYRDLTASELVVMAL